MNKRRLKRIQEQKPQGRRLIIACEGEASEPNYFNGIRIKLELASKRVTVVNCKHNDPEGIVRHIIDYRSSERDWDSQDQAWAVFDGDEHRGSPGEKDKWHRAIDLARRKNVELAISNPAFEYWYLLHFQAHHAYLSKGDAKRLLKKHLPNYEKSDSLYAGCLEERTETALARAQTIRRSANSDGKPDYDNPHCGVWRLVELLLTMKK